MTWEGARGRGRRAAAAVAVASAVAIAGAAAGGAGAAAEPGPRAVQAARAPVAQLELERAIPLPGGATVYRYRQQVGGVDVLDGEAIVLDPPAAAPDLFADATAAQVEPPGQPAVPRDRAIALALRAATVERLRGPPDAETAIEPDGEGGNLVWRVRIPSVRPLGDFEVLVDAGTGAILAERNLLRFRTGSARLFVPNPVVAQGSYYKLRRDRRDRDTARLTALRELVELSHLRGRRGCLKGRYAETLLGPREKEVCRRSRTWNGVTRSNDRFEALMAYHWIDRTQTYLQGLGFSDDAGLGAGDRRQLVIANAFSIDNSFYTPFDRRIELGAGGVDDGEDADVIVHEYGHAIQDDQVRDFGSHREGGAMGEGFGDYLAATMTAEIPGVPLPGAALCIFDWDGISYSEVKAPLPECGRTAGTEDTKTDREGPPCRREIHCWGEVWSSALWDLRVLLGDDPQGHTVLDRVLLASHFLLTPRATFCDGALALLAADDAVYRAGEDGDGIGQHFNEIRNEMVDREFLRPSLACRS